MIRHVLSMWGILTLKGFAANALSALFGFGFAGLIHEDRRRRGPRRLDEGERPA